MTTHWSRSSALRDSCTYVWQDGPHTHYPAHTHATLTAHIIVGEHCDVPAGTVHAARMGSHGCRYLIGEKQPCERAQVEARATR
jgi:hypothetical protein